MAIINIKNTAGDWEEMPALQGNPDDFINLVYPVGSIYMSVNDVSPSTLFGGSWEKIEDTFLLASGSTFALGQTGGEINHTLTIDEMPSHTHNIQQREENPTMVSSFYNGVYDPGGIEFIMTEAAKTIIDRTASDHLFNSSTGGGQPHNNMPPYLVVNIWKRISQKGGELCGTNEIEYTDVCCSRPWHDSYKSIF